MTMPVDSIATELNSMRRFLGAARGARSPYRLDPCSLLYRLAEERPGEAAWLRLSGERFLILQDAASAAHMLRTNPGNYHKQFATFAWIFGGSRLTSDGASWRALQKLSQPCLTACEPERIATAVRRHFGRAVDQMIAERGPGPMVIDRFIDRAAAGVVLETLFGFERAPFADSAFDDLRVVLRYCGKASWSPAGNRFPPDPPARAAAVEALQRWRLEVRDLLGAAEGRCQSGLLDDIATGGPDCLDRFAEFTTLLFAGSDTSAATLGWSLWLLAGMPALQERLRSEIKSVLADGPATAAKVDALPDLSACVNEAVRIFPPVPFLSRVALAHDHIGGHAVTPGQKVLLSIIGLHHDRRYWPDPAEFDHGRFADGVPSKEQRQHFLPFSDGPRGCGGRIFALTELPIALMAILPRLRVRRSSEESVEFEWAASLRRAGGQPIAIEPL